MKPVFSLSAHTELTLTFRFYAVAAEHPSQLFWEILFDLRISKTAQYIFSQAHTYRLRDFGLDTAIEVPHVGPRHFSVLMNIVVEQTNASYVCKRVMSI